MLIALRCGQSHSYSASVQVQNDPEIKNNPLISGRNMHMQEGMHAKKDVNCDK